MSEAALITHNGGHKILVATNEEVHVGWDANLQSRDGYTLNIPAAVFKFEARVHQLTFNAFLFQQQHKR